MLLLRALEGAARLIAACGSGYRASDFVDQADRAMIKPLSLAASRRIATNFEVGV